MNPKISGSPERFRDGPRLTFSQALTEADARWWNEIFLKPPGLYPEDVAERFAGTAPGARAFRFDRISSLDQSFVLTIERGEGNRRIWFQASELRVMDGLLYQDRLDVDAEYRGRRIAQQLMRGVLRLMQIRRIRIEAQDVGSYVWAIAYRLDCIRRPKGSDCG
jgi:GNAT superfamily N-acetyltransferase